MMVRCGNCGEELLGAVNRCWRCGTRIESVPGDAAQPPVRRSPVAAIPAPAVEADQDAPVVARRVGSPFAESALAPAVAAVPPADPPSRFPVVRPQYPSRSASTGGAIAALVLGAMSLAISFFTPWAVITALLSLALGVWGLHAPRRSPAIIGLLLGCLAVAIGGFHGAVRLYELHYGHSPWETPLDDVPGEASPAADQIGGITMDHLPTIPQAADLLRRQVLSPEALVDHCLQRIRRFDDRVHAWVTVDDEGARREAQRLGILLRSGQDLGPLHGIPIGIKDIIDVRGLPTEAGSPLLKGRVVSDDAPVVAQLRAAGAIILGKTVTTEFACFDPSPTRNPWNLEHTPGGSSSGSAAAVALEMCLAAVGSQTGGSITRPASYCGVAGLKPTRGRVSTAGAVPISERLDHVGPIARTVPDLAIMFAAMQGSGFGVQGSGLGTPASPTPEPRPPTPEPRTLNPEPRTPNTFSSLPALHVIEEFFMEQADESVRAVTRAALDRLRSAGADLGVLRLPASFGQVIPLHTTVMAVDLAQTHFLTFMQQRAAYGPKISALIDEGLSTLAIDYALALRHQVQFRKDIEAVLQDTIAVTPATVTAAPAGLDSTGDPRFNSPWSYAGLPTVTIPCGLTEDGLPCGLQFIGPPDRDAWLLSVAEWCEQVLAFRATPPLWGDGQETT